MNLKRKTLAAAMLAALAAAGHAAAGECDSCDGKCKTCKPAKACNDRGLLDMFDKAAGHFQASLKARLHAKKDSPSSACDTPGCSCSTGGSSQFGNEVEFFPEVVPAPLPYGSEPFNIPTPDVYVDPFKDDTARRLRQVPVRSIEYHRPVSQPQPSYDPQAFNNYRVRLSDEGGAAHHETQSTAEFLTGKSSRRQAASGAVDASKPAAVVTASTSVSPATIRDDHSRPLPTGSTAAGTHSNPLRSNP